MPITMANSRKPYSLPTRLREILITLSVALVDLPDDVVIADHDNKIADACLAILSRMHFLPRFGFCLAAYFFDVLPVFFGQGTVRFVHLAAQPRREYVSRWLSAKGSVFREILKALRGIVLLSVFTQEEVCLAMGYDPKIHVQERIARRESLLRDQGREFAIEPLSAYLTPSNADVVTGTTTATHSVEDEQP